MNELIRDAQNAISVLTHETRSLHAQIFELRRELKAIMQNGQQPHRTHWEAKFNDLNQIIKRLEFTQQEINHWNNRIFWEGQPIPDRLPEFALSVRQPWGYRILFEGKDIENRDRRTNKRGTIFIHSALTIEEDGQELAERLRLPVGGLIGTVDIVDCVSASDSKWFFGPYGYVLANPRPMPFVQCRGMPGFFKPDVDWASERVAL